MVDWVKLRCILSTVVFSWTAMFIYIGWLFLFSQTNIAAKLHGTLWPVVTQLEILSVEETTYRGMPATRISGSALKLRDCSPEYASWYLHGNDGLKAPIDGYFEDVPEIRKRGVQRWEGIVIGVDASRLEDISAEMVHSCGRFPVISKFYTGGNL